MNVVTRLRKFAERYTKPYARGRASMRGCSGERLCSINTVRGAVIIGGVRKFAIYYTFHHINNRLCTGLLFGSEI